MNHETRCVTWSVRGVWGWRLSSAPTDTRKRVVGLVVCLRIIVTLVWTSYLLVINLLVLITTIMIIVERTIVWPLVTLTRSTTNSLRRLRASLRGLGNQDARGGNATGADLIKVEYFNKRLERSVMEWISERHADLLGLLMDSAVISWKWNSNLYLIFIC